MFPLRDNIPAKHPPFVNIGLISINVLVFLYEWQLSGQLQQFLMEWGFVPARFQAQQAMDVLDLSRFLPVFTSMFLHGGLLHLVFNMWMLWIFGDNVEDSMGHGRYLIFYLLCGVAAVFAQFWSAPQSAYPMVGASGAIAGVLGAYFLSYPRAKVLTLVPIFILFYLIEIPAFVFLGLWFLLQFIQGSFHLLSTSSLPEGGVAWWAHVGGFACGVLLLPLFRKKQDRQQASRAKW